MKRTKFLRLSGAVLLAAITAAWANLPAAIHASDLCGPPNVIPKDVCDMNTFHGQPPRQVPDGWTEFVLSGSPNFYQECHTYFECPNLTIASSGGTFKAGIYTQAKVTPGAGYRASIAWGAPNAPDLFGRQLGIDPTGGTDPNAPTVIWGPVHWGPGRFLNYPPPDVNIDVKARAVGDTMTVFFVADHPQSSGDNIILIDVIGLYPDDSAPAAQIPPTPTPAPTSTPAPPAPVAAAAAAVPPTATPAPLPTDTPLPPTATPTDTPSPTPTATNTPLPTATWTPWPTATALPALSVPNAQKRALALAHAVPAQAMLAISLISFSAAGLCGVLLLWLRRRR